MNNSLAPALLRAQVIRVTPLPAQLKQGGSDRKTALFALSGALLLAVGCIALVIGSGNAEAANLPIFTASNALSAKQDASIGGIAAASIAIISFAALALFSVKKV